MAYSFTVKNPPLLKDTDGDIFTIPAADLEQQVGQEMTWTTTPAAAPDGSIITKTFHLKRRLFWSLSEIPVHYNTDETVKIKYTSGYSKTQKESMEKNLNAKVGGSFLGLTAEVSAGLKLTEDYSQEWHEETTVETEVKYEKDHTYCSWRLNDSIELLLETASSTAAQPPVVTLTPLQDRILSVISIYRDSAADSNKQLINNALKATRFLGEIK